MSATTVLKREPPTQSQPSSNHEQQTDCLPKEGQIHSFSRSLGKQYGPYAAILLAFLSYKAQHSHYERNGKKWHRETLDELAKRYPYMSRSTINKELRKLQASGVITIGKFNRTKYDHTQWYAIAEPSVMAMAGREKIYFNTWDASQYGLVGAVILEVLSYSISAKRQKRPDYEWHRVTSSGLSGWLPFTKREILHGIELLVDNDELERKRCEGYDRAYEYRILKPERLNRPVNPAPLRDFANVNKDDTERDVDGSGLDQQGTFPPVHGTKPDNYNSCINPLDSSIQNSFLREDIHTEPLTASTARVSESCLNLPKPFDGGSNGKASSPNLDIPGVADDMKGGSEESQRPTTPSFDIELARRILRKEVTFEDYEGTAASCAEPKKMSESDVPFNAPAPQAVPPHDCEAEILNPFETLCSTTDAIPEVPFVKTATKAPANPRTGFQRLCDDIMQAWDGNQDKRRNLGKLVWKQLYPIAAKLPLETVENWKRVAHEDDLLREVMIFVEDRMTGAWAEYNDMVRAHFRQVAAQWLVMALQGLKNPNHQVTEAEAYQLLCALRKRLDDRAKENKEAKRIEHQTTVIAEYNQRKQKFDQSFPNLRDTALPAQTKANLLKKAIIGLNRMGILSAAKNPSFNGIEYSDASIRAARKFFEANPEMTPADILERLQLCWQTRVDVPAGDGFNPFFHVHSGTNLSAFLTHMDKILAKLGCIQDYPLVSFLSKEELFANTQRRRAAVIA